MNHKTAVLTFIMFVCGIVTWYSSAMATSDTIVRRTILGLYSSTSQATPQWTKIHQFAEMPLNHLGIRIKYHNIKNGLPDLNQEPDLLGVLTWFNNGTRLKQPLNYLEWLESLVRNGKKIVIMGDPGFRTDQKNRPVSPVYINRFFRLIGIRDMDQWIQYTYDLERLKETADMIEFERKYRDFHQAYDRLVPFDPAVKSHLVVHKANQSGSVSHLIMTFPSGGYVAEGFAMHMTILEGKQVRQWYINPFAFFRLAFDTDRIPKPDVNTLAGRRIFYSHIDGDGWLNKTQIEEYRKKSRLSSEVILEKVVKAYPDIPVTVTAVAAELDPGWSGNRKSEAIARAFFRLPNVEIGTHTYSHPFNWQFFADNNPDKEIPYLNKYPNGGWNRKSLGSRLLSFITPRKDTHHGYTDTNLEDNEFATPRAYAHRPFDLDLEISGSAAFLNSLAPPGKKVAVLTWTGNTSPFEEAIKRTREAGLYNINGGDSRFDVEYPSYAWISQSARWSVKKSRFIHPTAMKIPIPTYGAIGSSGTGIWSKP